MTTTASTLEKYKKEEADNAYNETFLPITTNHYLFLSGTPFRAINSGRVYRRAGVLTGLLG